MFASGVNNLAKAAWQRVRAEPGRAGTLSALVVLMGILWARALLTGEKSPAAAAAAAAVPGTSGNTLAASPGGARPGQRSLGAWLKTPMGTVNRNLFLIKYDNYQLDGGAGNSGEAAGDGFWDQVGKSISAKADLDKARRIYLDNLKEKASKLELQSTVMRNGAPRALINGTMVGVGDSIDSFKLLRIEARKVVVEREGVKFELSFSLK